MRPRCRYQRHAWVAMFSQLRDHHLVNARQPSSRVRGEGACGQPEHKASDLVLLLSWSLALAALGAACSVDDECPHDGETWCKGTVIESCRGDEVNKRIVQADDCANYDAQCADDGHEASCVFADLSCSGLPAQACERGWLVTCPEGWTQGPILALDCEGTVQAHCVETDRGTADCSDVPFACTSASPASMCFDHQRWGCSDAGFWVHEGTANDSCMSETDAGADAGS